MLLLFYLLYIKSSLSIGSPCFDSFDGWYFLLCKLLFSKLKFIISYFFFCLSWFLSSFSMKVWAFLFFSNSYNLGFKIYFGTWSIFWSFFGPCKRIGFGFSISLSEYWFWSSNSSAKTNLFNFSSSFLRIPFLWF